MVPTLHDTSQVSSPGKMHHFQVVDSVPSALPPSAVVAVPVKATKPKTSNIQSSCVMSSDLQVIMNRRRQMADTMSSDNLPTAALLNTTTNNGLMLRNNKSPYRHRQSLKTVAMSSDLQAIMTRRRRMAGDEI
jgi:hypothetical protein